MKIRRAVRRTWIPMVLSAAWVNRHDVVRWYGFARRSMNRSVTLADVLLEARVRASVSADPLLRRDPALDDIEVRDGVVTLRTNSASWPDPRNQLWRLKRIKGVTDVRSVVADATTDRTTPPPVS